MGKIIETKYVVTIKRDTSEFWTDAAAIWCLTSGLFTAGWIVWELIQWVR